MATPIYKAPDAPTPRLTTVVPAHLVEAHEPTDRNEAGDPSVNQESYRAFEHQKRFVWDEYQWRSHRGVREVYPPPWDDDEEYAEAQPTKRDVLKAKQNELRRQRIEIDRQLLDIEEALLD